MFNFSANHLFLLSRTEYRSCAVFALLDRDTKRVYRLYRLHQTPPLLQPHAALLCSRQSQQCRYTLPGDRIGQAATPSTSDFPLFLILLTAREGCLCPKTLPLGKPAPGTHALRSAAGVAADVRANNKTSALSDYKTSGNAGILFRR